MRRSLVVGIVMALTACGRDSVPITAPGPTATPAPTPAPAPVQTVPFALEGSVSDTLVRPVEDARIEVVDGSQAGATTTSDATGRFSFGDRRFTDAVTLRASKEGYATVSESAGAPLPGNAAFLRFLLDSAPPSVDLSGSYTLTLIADPACADLPADAVTRTFAATISHGYRTAYYNVVVDAPSLIGDRVMGASVFATLAQFWVVTGPDSANGIVERFGPNGFLDISGEVTAQVERFPLDVQFSGSFSYCPGPANDRHTYFACAVTATACESKAHRLTLSRK